MSECLLSVALSALSAFQCFDTTETCFKGSFVNLSC